MAMKSKKTAKNVCVEVPLADGCLSMHVGRLVQRDDKRIVLVDAAWVACTGRRNVFFAGKFDSGCEVEPLPDGVQIELPADRAIITDWPHDLLCSVR